MDKELTRAWHRGYDTCQLDMERMEVARRVDAVTLDNGSHGNLSAIASAIYEPRFGWTSGACAMLRDKLVRLLGGTHERDCRGGRDDTGAPRPDSSDGEQAEEVNLLGGGEPTLSDLWCVWKDADGTCPNNDGTCPNDGLTSSITDERHKAACELRKIHTDAGGFVKALANALGVEWQAPRVHQTIANVRDRLIYLIGGDETNFTEIAETINLGNESDSELMENGENHKMATITDELRECVDTAAKSYDNTPWYDMDEGEEADHTTCHITEGELMRIADRIDARYHLTSIVAEASTSDEWTAMSEYDKVRRQRDELRAELEELRGQSRTCPKSDEEMSESAPSVSITDELRAYSRDSVKRDDYMGGLTFDLDRIADRIDEQFDRICEQHEAVLQSTIDDMCDELSGLEENNAELMANNDELTAKCKALMAANADLAKGIDDARESEYRAERQRDELQDRLAEYDLQSRLEEQGDITMTHREMRRMLGEVKHLHDTLRARSNAMSQVTKERDELRRTCAELRRELEGETHGRD